MLKTFNILPQKIPFSKSTAYLFLYCQFFESPTFVCKSYLHNASLKQSTQDKLRV